MLLFFWGGGAEGQTLAESAVAVSHVHSVRQSGIFVSFVGFFRLEQSELQLDETIFILQTYLHYQQLK